VKIHPDGGEGYKSPGGKVQQNKGGSCKNEGRKGTSAATFEKRWLGKKTKGSGKEKSCQKR